MIPNVSDSDPDPTSQIPWPAARPRQAASSEASTEATVDELGIRTPVSDSKKADLLNGKRKLTTWDLVTLSISMAGAQVAWTVELGYVTSSTPIYYSFTASSYGTPFLLKLGLSEQLTSLVWLAGPISGLVAQPIIGPLYSSLLMIHAVML